MSTTLMGLRLPTKAWNALYRWRPTVTLQELSDCDRRDLAAVPNFGQESLDALHARLREAGYQPKWRPELDPKPGRALTGKAADLAKIREVLAKTTAGDGAQWFVEHGATRDGRSRIDDGRVDSGMHGVYGEAHDCELAALCVNFVTRHVLGIQEE